MQGNASNQGSYWQVFYDDIGILFFFSAAITFIVYTVWGLVELGTVGNSPLVGSLLLK